MNVEPRDPAAPDISVSVVTYNSAEDLPGLLDSLRRQNGVSWELLVVDNASHDGTIDTLSRLAPEAHLIRNASNRGFGAAHNQNLPLCRGRCVVLLNPDLTLEDGALAALREYLDAHPNTAIVGPALLHDPLTRWLPPATEYPGEHLAVLPGRPLTAGIAWVSGACFAIRADVFRDLGGFDEDYFLYAEEVDLCYRATQTGWRIGYAAQPKVRHAGFGSQAGVSPLEREVRICHGREIFYRKHYPPELLPALHRAIVLESFTKRSLLGLLRPLLPGQSERAHSWQQAEVSLSAQIQVSTEWLARRDLPLLAPDRHLFRILGHYTARSLGRIFRRPK